MVVITNNKPARGIAPATRQKTATEKRRKKGDPLFRTKKPQKMVEKRRHKRKKRLSGRKHAKEKISSCAGTSMGEK